MPIPSFQVSAPTTIGANVASATPGGTVAADLVSAASNTGGIVIKSLSISLAYPAQNGTTTTAYVTLKINNVAVAAVRATAGQNSSNTAAGNNCLGGIALPLKVPAGQAVGYSMTSASGYTVDIFMTWDPA